MDKTVQWYQWGRYPLREHEDSLAAPYYNTCSEELVSIRARVIEKIKNLDYEYPEFHTKNVFRISEELFSRQVGRLEGYREGWSA